jgi:hypothetical protein
MSAIAVRQAIHASDNHLHWTKEKRRRAAAALVGFGVFSNRQVARMTGLRHDEVAPFSTKTSKVGGNLSVESLPLILEIIEMLEREEISDFAIRNAVSAGASTRMVARLAGLSQSYVARASKRPLGSPS